MSAEHITNQQHIRNITIKNEGVQLEAIKQSIINDKLDQKRVPGIEQKPSKRCLNNPTTLIATI